MSKAAFFVGQLVEHRLFNYRGVIVDVDPVFSGTDEWYETVARTRPPRDKPWYRVLVHGQASETYVAERNLVQDRSQNPIEHPLVDRFFTAFENGAYVSRRGVN